MKNSNDSEAPVSSVAGEFSAFIGLDWADQKHQISLRAAGSGTIERMELAHKAEAIHDWLKKLRQRFPAGKIALGLEQGRGGLINALIGYEFLVLYILNPKAVARFRESFRVSGAKSDPLDADCQLELLISHREHLKPWLPEDADTRLLGKLVEDRRNLVNQQTMTVLAVQSALKAYYPLALELAGQKLAGRLAGDFLAKWPTLESLQAAKIQTVRRFFFAHHVRYIPGLEERLARIAKTVPLTTDRAAITALTLRVHHLNKVLKEFRNAIEDYDARIEELFKNHPEAALFRSLPGAGPAMEPRLLVSFGTQRERFPSALSMTCFSGTAPITRASGKCKEVHRRLARPKFVHQTFVEYANCSIKFCAWAMCYYQHQCAQGHGPNSALRKLAIRWQRIIWSCWQAGTVYDEAKYVKGLVAKCPELYAKLAPLPSKLKKD